MNEVDMAERIQSQSNVSGLCFNPYILLSGLLILSDISIPSKISPFRKDQHSLLKEFLISVLDKVEESLRSTNNISHLVYNESDQCETEPDDAFICPHLPYFSFLPELLLSSSSKYFHMRKKVRSLNRVLVTKMLSQILFQQLSFHGDTEIYFTLENSMISHVIHNKRGIPLTLSSLYVLSAAVIGLQGVQMVGMPRHVCVSVELRPEVDHFEGNIAHIIKFSVLYLTYTFSLLTTI
jgi:hypothetical protein